MKTAFVVFVFVFVADFEHTPGLLR
jgi:hypothetical protein